MRGHEPISFEEFRKKRELAELKRKAKGTGVIPVPIPEAPHRPRKIYRGVGHH